MANFYNSVAFAVREKVTGEARAEVDRAIAERFPGFVLDWDKSTEYALYFVHSETMETAKTQRERGDAIVIVGANYREPSVQVSGEQWNARKTMFKEVWDWVDWTGPTWDLELIHPGK